MEKMLAEKLQKSIPYNYKCRNNTIAIFHKTVSYGFYQSSYPTKETLSYTYVDSTGGGMHISYPTLFFEI